ncbi:hypothetical protein MUB23_00405 [Cuneatibacter sp. NSJ-177]|uniref:hypothetical protein n=1 Tax=Cuneatibacter sp. NSJ-177 TaxID=2931401 RepID=UPI001FD44EAA|nr:hypothetical protein [Cuneatibacter sp. NSJ-177]MCJ7833853.1 hypothetical protein [Cuneatibacter sp. NSJ-177]
MMSNLELKEKIKNAGLFQWQVADTIGVSDVTFCKWLRKPLSPDKEQAVLEALQKLKEAI